MYHIQSTPPFNSTVGVIPPTVLSNLNFSIMPGFRDLLSKIESSSGRVELSMEELEPITRADGIRFFMFNTTANQLVAVHQDSYDEFSADVTDEGTLPLEWRISESGMLYKRQPKSTKKPWER